MSGLENVIKHLTEMWYVYLLTCSDNTLYCGVTNDLAKRIYAHNNLNTGAKYTRLRRPVKLVYYEEQPNKSAAMKREWQIKQLNRSSKLKLIDENHGKLHL